MALAGCLSLGAALAHLATIAGGADWYRTMGAGERMARAAERGDAFPAIATLGIALLLAVWAAYAASGAGLIARLPLLRTALVAITLVYLARGMVLFWPGLLRRPDLTPAFLFCSSLIVLAIGAVHAIGVWKAWPLLAASGRG
ncbi:MAG: hypothetical protein LC648_06610 [Novosphingobium sp.]|nr:hypothetical protein [Novosphingobium sp.]